MQQQRTGNTRTFLAVEPEEDRVVGYYATTTCRLDLDEAAKAYGAGKRVYPVRACSTPSRRASVQQQDMTSFVLGAALERARAVLAEDRLLRLTPHQVNQLEKALDREPQAVTQLAALVRRAAASSAEPRGERISS